MRLCGTLDLVTQDGTLFFTFLAPSVLLVRKASELGPRCLFEVVQRLHQEADMIRVVLVDEFGRLMIIDAFRQVAVEERVFYVELVHGPASGCS